MLINISTFKIGAGNVENTHNIYYDEKNPGGTSLIKTDKSDGFQQESIEIKKVDGLLNDTKIDFIKMDIEGFEYEAILGMEKILKNNNLKMVLEYSPHLFKWKEKDYKKYAINMLNCLNTLGFILFHITEYGNLQPILDNEKYFIKAKKLGYTDIMCFKK